MTVEVKRRLELGSGQPMEAWRGCWYTYGIKDYRIGKHKEENWMGWEHALNEAEPELTR